MNTGTQILEFNQLSKTTPIVIPTSEGTISMSVDDVTRWVAPQAPPGECLKFLLTCRSAELNPFLGEAYLVPMGGKWSTIIAKAGYLKRAQKHPDYAGHDAGIIIQKYDSRAKQKVGDPIDTDGTLLPDGYVVIGGWAKVWRRGVDRPIHIRLSMAEYNKDSGTWKSIPCTMIRKTALVHAIREAFAIGDSYDQAEIEPSIRIRASATGPDGGRGEPQPVLGPPSVVAGRGIPALEASYQTTEDPSLPPELLGRIETLMAEAGMTEFQLQTALAKRGLSRLAEMSRVQGEEFASKLEEIARPLADGIADEIAADSNGQGVQPTDDQKSEEFILADAPRRGQPAETTPETAETSA
jgi:phage recombination protein Bet